MTKYICGNFRLSIYCILYCNLELQVLLVVFQSTTGVVKDVSMMTIPKSISETIPSLYPCCVDGNGEFIIIWLYFIIS